MPLHHKSGVRHQLEDELFSCHLLSQPLPKYRFPKHEAPAAAAYQLVHDELLLDGNSRQNLATFCQTWLEPEVHKIMDDCLDKNMIDKDEYPQTAEIEERAVHMIADLWNSPDAADAVGCSTTGSSEAAMLGGLGMKWKWRKKRQAAGKFTDKPNLVCGPVQVCWHKFARYFDVELREIPCQGQRLLMSPEEAVRRCDENTIGVVPTLGVTFTLQYEPVREIAAALDKLQQETGLDIPVHVDGASGGFVAPFLHPDVEWDFRLPRVKSINASGHKFGLAPLGCGWVIWREATDLPEDLIFRVDYLGGDMPTFALNFSRPGGQIIAQYYNFIRLGREGYTRIQKACAEVGAWFSDEVAKLGPFEVIYDGRGGLPGCSWKIKDGIDPGYNLYDLSERLRVRGWQVAAYPLPANRRETVIQRVIARHGFSRDLACLLLADMKRAIEYFQQRPVAKPLTHKEGAGFRH